MHNKSVTLYLDCERVETLDLLRGDDAVVSTEGVTVFGTRLLDEEVFEVCYYEIILDTKKTNGLFKSSYYYVVHFCVCKLHLDRLCGCG